LRVMPSGHKSWCFAYRERGKRRQMRMTLGGFPDISVTRAREIVRVAREELALGFDPMTRRAEKIQERHLLEQEFVTVEKMSEDFVENYAKPKNRSWKQTQQSFTKYINPDLGDKPAKDVKRKDVVQLLDKLKASKHPHTARLEDGHRASFSAFINEVDIPQETRGIILSLIKMDRKISKDVMTHLISRSL
jgi:hypothetical protein